jgi:hypothetical protein
MAACTQAHISVKPHVNPMLPLTLANDPYSMNSTRRISTSRICMFINVHRSSIGFICHGISTGDAY